MVMNRRTFIVKRGRMQEAATLLKAAAQRSTNARAYRIYVPEFAPFDVLCIEGDFDSLAEYQQYWAEYFAQPETTAMLERWYDVTETGGTNELWELVE
jgi:hypothetical protein